MFLRCLSTLVLLLLGALGAAAKDAKPVVNHCLECHAAFDGKLGDPARQFPDDIHATRGLTCADCHGGNPSQEDAEKAMDRKQGFRGVPKRSEIPQLCARCHSDGAFMRAYNPSLRTDQLTQYGTSVHGKRLRAGDTRVAVCSDCHSPHSIRPASSPLSTVHAPQIPMTCGRCHADPMRMKPYGIPTNQLDDYRGSVHYQTLTGGDLSAPTCATCHGNHGAAPPGVASIERVCGTCHVFQEQLFDQSPHKAPWQAAKIAACLTCHGNHRVEHTGDALLGTGGESLCLRCHAKDDAGGKTAQRIYADLTGLDSNLGDAAAVLDRAERAGMEVGEARLTLSNGREKLIKARVDVHTMIPARVEQNTEEGRKLALQAQQAGQQALAEYAYRRKGLALSLIAIAFVVGTLWLLIRSIERRPPAGEEVTRP
ncbi:MAG: cytochrome c3 family protein [Acidobacteria bacterium]|nr:cytochrome c3 family protein [Acidobacteriota bacterium]